MTNFSSTELNINNITQSNENEDNMVSKITTKSNPDNKENTNNNQNKIAPKNKNPENTLQNNNNNTEIQNIIKPPKKILKPRDYQQKIFEKAKNQNSIIYVETGRGKTFISIMLMADLLEIDLTKNISNIPIKNNKKILFLVCDTSLILQQKNSIEENLGITVNTIQGKKNKKSKSEYEIFRKLWDSANIFVAIPTILYKLFSVGFLTIFEVDMIVFDECHHTDSEHPYNKIMNEFYFFYKKKNVQKKFPQIIGLTASPLKNGIKGKIEIIAKNAMKLLCENLDSVFIIDPDILKENKDEKQTEEEINNSNMQNFIQVNSQIKNDSYIELIKILYNKCFYNFIIFGFNDLVSKKLEKKKNKDNFIKIYNDFTFSKFNSENLMEYNMKTQEKMEIYSLRKNSIYLDILETIQRQIFMIIGNLNLEALINFFDKLIKKYENFLNKKENIENKYDIDIIDDEETETNNNLLSFLNISSIKELYTILTNTNNELKKIIKINNFCSDRLTQMYNQINILFSKNANSKFIIFIGNRIVAHFLSPILTFFLNKNHPTKKCQEIIGINKKKTDTGTITPSKTLAQLNKIISDFNNDKFQILIGTSAVEEGLDIQTCNAVLVFVELMTPKSFIQMKGRARKKNSDFIVFTNSVEKTKNRILDFIKSNKIMKEFFGNNIVKDFRSDFFIQKKESIGENIVVEKTQAKLTLGNCTEFFNEIKQQILNNNYIFEYEINIKQEKAKNKNNGEYEYIGYLSIIKTDLKIVKNSYHKDGKKRKYNKGYCFISERKQTKTMAEKLCHFYIIKQLYNEGYLDEHFKFINK